MKMGKYIKKFNRWWNKQSKIEKIIFISLTGSALLKIVAMYVIYRGTEAYFGSASWRVVDYFSGVIFVGLFTAFVIGKFVKRS